MLRQVLMQFLPIFSFASISLGIGCAVCQNAKKDTGTLKIIGYIIGVIIIVVAILSFVLTISMVPQLMSMSQKMQGQMMRPGQSGQVRRPQAMQPQAVPKMAPTTPQPQPQAQSAPKVSPQPASKIPAQTEPATKK